MIVILLSFILMNVSVYPKVIKLLCIEQYQIKKHNNVSNLTVLHFLLHLSCSKHSHSKNWKQGSKTAKTLFKFFWCRNITHNNIWQNDNSQNSTQQNDYITVKCYSDDSYYAEFHFNECLSIPKSYQIAVYRKILDRKA